MKRDLILFYREMLLPLLFVFSFCFLLFVVMTYVRTSVLISEQPSPVTSDVVILLALLSGFLTLMFLPIFLFTYVMFNWSPKLGRRLARRISLETAYNLKSVLGSSLMPIAMLALTFMLLMYLTGSFPYFLVTLAFICVLTILVSVWGSVLNEKEEASFLLCQFSQDIKAGIKKRRAFLPSSRKFAKGLKAFDKILPRASNIPSMDRRISQVQLVLSVGEKKDLSALSRHVLAVTQSMKKDYLEGFDKKHRNFTAFLDAFEYDKRGVTELTEKTSLRDKMQKSSGGVLREIVVKTTPILISILISVLIFMWLGIKPPLFT